MIYYLILTICLLAAIFMAWKEEDTGYLAGFLFVGLVTTLIFSLAAIGQNSVAYNKKTFTFPLVAMRNGNSTSGSFFLGSGTVGTYEKYYFTLKTEDGRFYRDSIEVRDAYIKESDTESPNVSYEDTWYHNPLWFPSWMPYGHTRSDRTITIPKGSVVVNLYKVEP